MILRLTKQRRNATVGIFSPAIAFHLQHLFFQNPSIQFLRQPIVNCFSIFTSALKNSFIFFVTNYYPVKNAPSAYLNHESLENRSSQTPYSLRNFWILTSVSSSSFCCDNEEEDDESATATAAKGS